MKQKTPSGVQCDQRATRPAGASALPATEVAPESKADRLMRLEGLRAAIASGEYRIPAEVVADKLMERMHVQGSTKDDTTATSASDPLRARTGRTSSIRLAQDSSVAQLDGEPSNS